MSRITQARNRSPQAWLIGLSYGTLVGFLTGFSAAGTALLALLP
jgi:hypothetical protein